VVEQGTHKPLVGGSNPPSATSPIPSDELARAVADGAHRLRIPDDATIVLAVSGGPDSMALMHGAARLGESGRPAWQLVVAHLDHGLRPDSGEDASFVADAAAGLGLPCEVRRTDVAKIAESEGRSLEDAGREARYRFLEEVAVSRGASTLVATAHTADDAAETVLINLLRGSGLAGARGIPARRARIVRPLIEHRRGMLREALDRAGIAYRLDPTNADPTHLRNRIRNELLPLLEALRPGAVDALTRHARLAGDDDDLLNAIAAAELARRRNPASGEIDWHDPPARALGRRVLRLAIGDPASSAERIEALLDAAEGPRGGLVIELGGGRRAEVRERRIGLS
jgi:tRNA(Ile)-lysidine synthase